MAEPAFDLAELPEYTLATRNLVMYPHLNAASRLFGGQLISWIDEGCAMVAGNEMQRRSIATKKISEIVFDAPGHVGDIVEIYCKTASKGRSSLTLDCLAVVHRHTNRAPIPICRCSIVYVAIDAKTGKPVTWNPPE